MTAEEAVARLKELGFEQVGELFRGRVAEPETTLWARCAGAWPELALVISTGQAVRVAFWAATSVEGGE
jgi:hypothetical protein